jgi:hypothetical protein
MVKGMKAWPTLVLYTYGYHAPAASHISHMRLIFDHSAALQSPGLTKYGGLCKGAEYTNYLACQVKRREECTGACVWNTKVRMCVDH